MEKMGTERNFQTKAAPCHFSMHLAEWCLVSPVEVLTLPYTVLLIIFHRDVAVTLGYKAPFLSDHRKLDT